MLYLQLLYSFFKIGLFSFGGGYAAMPLIQEEVVNIHGWLTMPEFTDLITISQMTPGPIAINSATFVGIRVGGFFGAVVATIGCIIPSCVIVTLLAYLYIKYRQLDTLQGVLKTLRPAVVAMIATAGFSIIVTSFWPEHIIALNTIKIVLVVIFIVALFLLIKYKMNPIFVMVLAGIMNVVYQLCLNTLIL